MLRVCLFGHSFPARVDRYGRDHPEFLADLPDGCTLSIQGYSGLTYSRIFSDPQRFLSTLKEYDIIIVDLGTNDLCDIHITPSLLISRAISLLDLFDQHGVRSSRIVFLSILQRTNIFRHGQVTVSTFNHRVKKYNAQLAGRLDTMSPRVQLRSQSKFNRPKYILDGCHLTNEGIELYIKNIIYVITNLKSSLDPHST